jgi:hypothetical protein
VGGALLSVALWLLRPELKRFGMVDAPTSTVGVVVFGVVIAVACIFLAFVAIFLFRLLTAPGRLYSGLKDRVLQLQCRVEELSTRRITDLAIDLHESMAMCLDTVRFPSKPTKAF